MSLNASFFRLVIAEVWKKFYLKTFVSECTQWFSMGDFLILSQTLKPIQEWLGPLRTLRPAPYLYSSVQFSSAQSSLSRVQLFVTPWTAAHQASLSIINSQSFLKLMSVESVMPSNHLILCHPLLLLPSIFSSIRVFSNELALHTKLPKYWSFNFNISPSNEYSVLISFRIYWFDLLGVQGTLKSLLQCLS